MNPRLPTFLRVVLGIECLAVGAAAIALFGFPDWSREHWAWPTLPYHSRFMGAAYWAALVPLVIGTAYGRWAPGRLVLFMVLVFTSSLALVMLPYAAAFAWERPATWGFFGLYLFLPVNAALFLFRLRHWPPSLVVPATPLQRAVLGLIGTGVLGYGLAMLVTPIAATAFWPWPVDAFHARLYAAIYITVGAAGWWLRRPSAPIERSLLGITLCVFGIASIAGLVWTSAGMPPARQIDLASPGTWLYVGIDCAVAVIGMVLITLRAPYAAGRPACAPLDADASSFTLNTGSTST